jgi:hypothetical protein
MGTPAYMPPEQARGEWRLVDERADVFALGAILCKVLTGQTPYGNGAREEVRCRAKDGDLVGALERLGACGADESLVGLCRDCLAPVPEGRPRHAGEVAERVAAYQAEVRERLRQAELERAQAEVRAREERKRRRLAATLAGVLVALAAVAVWLAVVAERRKGDALRANNNLVIANGKLEQSRDELVLALVRTLLRPLALRNVNQPMIDHEWDALWDLATNRGQLGYPFVEEASRTPGSSRLLRDRAVLALHAAVGLDARRREAVEALLLARLDDPALPDEQKADLALAASAWGGLSASGSGRTARQLVQAIKDNKDRTGWQLLVAEHLSAPVARLEAKEAAAALCQAIQDTKDPGALLRLAGGLSEVAARLDPKEAAAAAAQAAVTLVQAIKDTKDMHTLEPLAGGLSALAVHLEDQEAAVAAAQAAAALTSGGYSRRSATSSANSWRSIAA